MGVFYDIGMTSREEYSWRVPLEVSTYTSQGQLARAKVSTNNSLRSFDTRTQLLTARISCIYLIRRELIRYYGHFGTGTYLIGVIVFSYR